MPRLGLGFDMDQFLDHCRNTKPPYQCPHAACGKTYRSWAGIHNHMNTYDHENPPPVVAPKSARKKNMKGCSTPSEYEPDLPGVPFSHDLKSVEFELDGKITRLSVYDVLEIVSKEDYEATIPTSLDEPHTPDPAKTPVLKPQQKSSSLKTPKARNAIEKDKGCDVQRYTLEDKKEKSKLPEASFRIIDDYYRNLPDAPPLPNTYYKFVEKSTEELDEEIEYDMDEEDQAWLKMMNDKRKVDGLAPVKAESFELLMDRLEKESFFQAQSSGREAGIGGVPVDEDAVCCICMDGECQNSNVILFCDMCNLAVHQECYGVPYIPEGQWLCRRCLQSPSRAVDCVLCPNKGGAFKQTDDARWAHVVCAMWIPEVCFANTVFLEPIDSINNIPPARWKLTCYICKQRGVGACIQCNKVNCYTAYHVTCAQQAGLHMKIDAVRETNANGTSVTVRKAAYCDIHTPADSDSQPQLDDSVDNVGKIAAKAVSRQKMKKARKILAEKRCAAPVVALPIIPADKIRQLAELVTMDKRAQFIHRLLAFWTLKRQSRNGVPLLRRLSSHGRRHRHPSTASTDVPTEHLAEEKDDHNETRQMELQGKIRAWQRLRQDLERARLLCELIRKREKTKRELIRAHEKELEIKMSPLVHLFVETIDLILEKDPQKIFAEPVEFDEVPDYLDVIKHPMDLYTMRQKAQAHQYDNVDQFAADFELMVDNCLTYNNKDTIFYRSAVRMRDQGGAIIRQLKRTVDAVGFDLQTGLLLPHRKYKPTSEVTDNDLISEIDDALDTECDENKLEEREKFLLNLLDRVYLIRHPVARFKRIKLVKRDISIVRRRLAIGHASPHGRGRMKKNQPISDEDSEREESDSSIDDEAEPGEPSRPGSPGPLSPPISSTTRGTPKPGVVGVAKIPIAPQTPKLGSGRGRTFRRGTGNVGSPQVQDRKQKCIDSFFNKVGQSPKAAEKTAKSPDPLRGVKNLEKAIPDSKPPPKKTWKRGRRKRVISVSTTESVEPNLPVVKDLPVSVAAPPPVTPVKTPDAKPEGVAKVASSPAGVNRRTTVLFKKNPDVTSPQKRPGRPRKVSEGDKSAKECQWPVPQVVTEEKVEENAKDILKVIEKKVEDKVLATTQPEVATEKEVIVPKVEEVKEVLAVPPIPVPVLESLVIVDLTESAAPLAKDSFKMYRQGREITAETDEESHSDSEFSNSDSDLESGDESDMEEGGEGDSDSSGPGGVSGLGGIDQIPLEPLDLVWAKCRGYPWYPALIINPKMPRTGYFHNGVPIPVPPEDVLALAAEHTTPVYLVLFFDNKRTWQWLPRNKLEPLGVDSQTDKDKLVESRKATDRKAVKRAYEKAIMHRCRVTGEGAGLSDDSEHEEKVAGKTEETPA